jgi:hypothetical protein
MNRISTLFFNWGWIVSLGVGLFYYVRAETFDATSDIDNWTATGMWLGFQAWLCIMFIHLGCLLVYLSTKFLLVRLNCAGNLPINRLPALGGVLMMSLFLMVIVLCEMRSSHVSLEEERLIEQFRDR